MTVTPDVKYITYTVFMTPYDKGEAMALESFEQESDAHTYANLCAESDRACGEYYKFSYDVVKETIVNGEVV